MVLQNRIFPSHSFPESAFCRILVLRIQLFPDRGLMHGYLAVPNNPRDRRSRSQFCGIHNEIPEKLVVYTDGWKGYNGLMVKWSTATRCSIPATSSYREKATPAEQRIYGASQGAGLQSATATTSFLPPKSTNPTENGRVGCSCKEFNFRLLACGYIPLLTSHRFPPALLTKEHLP